MDKITTHSTDAISDLLAQYRNLPQLEALIGEVGARYQTLEDALWDVLTLRSVDEAFGAQLDGIGQIVGRTRDGGDDETYRLYLKAQILANRSSGTIPQLLAILALVRPDIVWVLSEQFPRAVLVRASSAAGLDHADTIWQLINRARMAGIRLFLQWNAGPDSQAFGFANSGGLGFGAGRFSSVR